MTTIIRLKNRMLFKNGDSEVHIYDGIAKTTYTNKKLAIFVHEGFEKAGKEHDYDGETTVTEYYHGMKEEEIVEEITAQLDSAISKKMFGQKISYTIEKLKGGKK